MIVFATNVNFLCLFLKGTSVTRNFCFQMLAHKSLFVACRRDFNPLIPAYHQIQTFRCASGNLLAASFQCDGVKQCQDGEDEQNCDEALKTKKEKGKVSCTPFELGYHRSRYCTKLCPDLYVVCDDGRCIAQDALCNGYRDCEDGWDEDICSSGQVNTLSLPSKTSWPSITNKQEGKCENGDAYNVEYRCIYDTDESGTALFCRDGSHVKHCIGAGCPRAFKCNLMSYCVPVRKVCDKRIDCPNGEDELYCEQIICHGLLQCRQSRVCVPPWEVCDGTVHCLDFLEDEIYCTPCPDGARCHGNAAIFDDSNSTMNLTSDKHLYNLKSLTCRNPYCADLVLQSSKPEGYNLIYIDVSGSKMSAKAFNSLLVRLPNVSLINAAHNLISSMSPLKQVHTHKILNLAHNLLTSLTRFIFSKFEHLVTLVLHHNVITSIERMSFDGLKALKVIDISHNALKLLYVLDMPKYSTLLEHMESDHMSLCCVMGDISHCVPTSERFSSCQNLLSKKLHRAIITLQALVTVSANCAVLALHRHLNQQEKIQMLQLTVANLLMAVYLAVMTTVDIFYRNHFSDVALTFAHANLCKITSALNFIASEVSLSMLVLVSFSRAYVIHRVWQKIPVRLIWTTCLAIWSFWVAYAALLLVALNYRAVPIESNICILVYFIETLTSNVPFIHSVIFVAVNVSQMVFIVCTYAIIAWNVFKSAMPVSSQKRRNQRHFAVKLSILMLFNLGCWIPMIISVLLGLLGYAVADELAIWMAIIVIPINARAAWLLWAVTQN